MLWSRDLITSYRFHFPNICIPLNKYGRFISFSPILAFREVTITLYERGSSSRLGKKKQLLTFKGTTLLNRVINLSINSHLGDVHVVLGYHADEIQQTITEPSVQVTYNKDWANGMGTSIAKGIQALPDDATGAFILLTDQIKLNSELLHSLKSEAQRFPHFIICCRYSRKNNSINFGTPCYFPSSHFDALRKYEGAAGAKKYIKDHMEEVRFVDFDGGDLDVDVVEDLWRLEDSVSRLQSPDIHLDSEY